MKLLYTLPVLLAGLTLNVIGSSKPSEQPATKPTIEEKKVQESTIKELTTKADLEKALKESGIKIIKFSAVWCGPCKMITPTIESLADKYKDKIKTYSIDADNKEFSAFQKEHNIMGLPTILCLPSGDSLRGARSNKEYETFFAKAALEFESVLTPSKK